MRITVKGQDGNFRPAGNANDCYRVFYNDRTRAGFKQQIGEKITFDGGTAVLPPLDNVTISSEGMNNPFGNPTNTENWKYELYVSLKDVDGNDYPLYIPRSVLNDFYLAGAIDFADIEVSFEQSDELTPLPTEPPTPPIFTPEPTPIPTVPPVVTPEPTPIPTEPPVPPVVTPEPTPVPSVPTYNSYLPFVSNDGNEVTERTMVASILPSVQPSAVSPIKMIVETDRKPQNGFERYATIRCRLADGGVVTHRFLARTY